MRKAGLLCAAFAALATALSAADAASASRVDFSSSPEGAAVILDGVVRGRAAPSLALFDVAAGRHHVRYELAGHEGADEFFTVGEGGYFSSNAVLEPLRGLLLLTTEPEGCSVTADGLALGETPRLVTSLDVNRRHRIELRKTGYQTKTLEIKFSGRTPVVRHEKMVLDSGVVRVETVPAGAKVTVNGIDKGVTPMTVNDVPRGRMSVKLSLQGHRDVVRELVVKPGDVQDLSVEMEPVPGRLHVTSVPRAAVIYVDGESHGCAPVDLGVRPGRHVVEAKLAGFDDLVREVDVGLDTDVRVEMRLESNLGWIEIRTDPVGATALMDGRVRGTTTARDEYAPHSDKLLIENVPAGEHTILIRCHGYGDFTKTVEVEPRRPVVLDVRLARVFTPNIRIETFSSTYVGELVRETPDSLVVLTAPGVERTFRKDIIRKAEMIDGGSGK